MRCSTFLLTMVLMTPICSLRAATLYYQDFETVPDGGTADQAGWQSFTGGMPQVRDNSIVSLHDSSWGHFIQASTAPAGYSQIGAALSSPLPNAGVVTFQAKAFFSSGNTATSGGVGLMNAAGNAYQAAWEINYDSSPSQAFWALDVRGLTGQSYPNSFEFVPKATYVSDFFDQTVFLSIFIDLDQQKVWGSVTNSANTSYTTSMYSFAGQPINIGTVSLGIDQRGSHVGGIDLDTIQVTSVPEPASLALIVSGLLGLALSRRRGKLSLGC